MNQALIKIFLIVALLSAASCERWAVLLCGSNGTLPENPGEPNDAGFLNYAHESNIFHAYKVLIKKGFDPEKIILFSYDDLAFNEENPFPGKMYNFPDPQGPGYDVREGVKIDYLDDEVNVPNFLNLLKGDDKLIQAKKKKLLKSNVNDTVFIYLIGHGSPGSFCFPGSTNWCAGDSALNYTDIIDTLNYMKQNNRYKKLVFFVESCYSGGIFSLLDNDINVYASSSSSKYHTSSFWYCGLTKYNSTSYGSNVVNGKPIGSCLSGQFSAAWMQFADFNDISNTTWGQEYDYALNFVTYSHPYQFGDLSFNNTMMSEILGHKNGQIDEHWKEVILADNNQTSSDIIVPGSQEGLNPSNVYLHHLQRKHEDDPSDEKKKKALKKHLAVRDRDEKIFYKIAKMFNRDVKLLFRDFENFENSRKCYSYLLADYIKYCGGLTPYRTQFLKIFVNACQTNPVISLFSDYIMKKACLVYDDIQNIIDE